MTSINRQLREAAIYGFIDTIKHCLSAKDCDPLFTDEEGDTALMFASRFGHENCVKLLLPRSDALAKDHGGYSVLMWAAMTGDETCVRLLLPHSDAIAMDGNGLTASQHAKNYGHPALAGMIHAYALSLTEAKELSTDVEPAPSRRSPAMRM